MGAITTIMEVVVAIITTTATNLHPAILDGYATFGGLAFRIEEGCFVPMPEMEGTARLALDAVGPGDTVLDIGCGVGTLGLWVSAHMPDIRLIGIDRLERALEMARMNAEELCLEASFYSGDLFEVLPPGFRADLVINTLPYEDDRFWQDEPYDGQPRSTYVADGSFARALMEGHEYTDQMVVYGLPAFDGVFRLADWEPVSKLTEDDITHWLVKSARA